VHLGTLDFGPADFGGGQHRGQVLAQQARPAPLGANVGNAKRRAGDHRQAQRRAQHLPAADGAVEFEHILVHL
jgi:hypothetical protein